MKRWPTCKSSRYKRGGFLAYLIHPFSLNHLSNRVTWDLPEERTLSWQDLCAKAQRNPGHRSPLR